MTTATQNMPITQRRRMKPREIIAKTVMYLTITAVSGLTFFPIYWMLVSTFQPNKYTMHYPPPFFPQELQFTQFGLLFQEHPVAMWLRNSFIIASLGMALCLVLTTMGAYTLSNLRWRARSLFGLFLLVTQMLPEILVLIPLYMLYTQLNLRDQIPSLAVVDAAFALPVCIWILKGVFDSVPTEVLDAAQVDGCGEFSALWRIVLPLSIPGIIAVAVVSFFAGWNEFLYASIMLTTGDLMPASVGLSTLSGLEGVHVEQYLAAGLTFSILPVLFYLTMQRYIISGLTAGAVKG